MEHLWNTKKLCSPRIHYLFQKKTKIYKKKLNIERCRGYRHFPNYILLFGRKEEKKHFPHFGSEFCSKRLFFPHVWLPWSVCVVSVCVCATFQNWPNLVTPIDTATKYKKRERQRQNICSWITCAFVLLQSLILFLFSKSAIFFPKPTTRHSCRLVSFSTRKLFSLIFSTRKRPLSLSLSLLSLYQRLNFQLTAEKPKRCSFNVQLKPIFSCFIFIFI